MAKLARNRSMFFASWTGTSIEEAASAVVMGDGITGATITAATFGTGVEGASGEYAFVYDGTAATWKLNGTTVTLTNYGLVVTGTPAGGDKIIVSYTAASGGWEAIGKDTDDLSKELNPDTETSKNVLGETTFVHSGYEPELAVETYYMDPSRIMFQHLQEIAMQELSGEDSCGGFFAEAFFESVDAEKQTMEGYCFVRRAWIVPQSVGGDTAGYSIPFNITPTGGKTKKHIEYDMATNIATITDIED